MIETVEKMTLGIDTVTETEIGDETMTEDDIGKNVIDVVTMTVTDGHHDGTRKMKIVIEEGTGKGRERGRETETEMVDKPTGLLHGTPLTIAVGLHDQHQQNPRHVRHNQLLQTMYPPPPSCLIAPSRRHK